jgi:hypothetical protein
VRMFGGNLGPCSGDFHAFWRRVHEFISPTYFCCAR